MIKSKKSQQEIITTVLLVLIALAAVAVIATFIIRYVRTSGEVSESKMNCISLDYEITQALNTATTVSIRRNTGGENVNVTSMRVLVDGSWVGNMTTAQLPAILETKTATVPALSTGQKVEIAPVLKGNTICDVKATKIVTAA